jgi:uncharacterized protein YegL
LPPAAGRGSRKNDNEQASNYFWTVTLVCLCLAGILLLFLLLTLVQATGGQGAGAGAGAGEVAGANGAGEEASKTAGSGAKDDSSATGSTPDPADVVPEQAGNEAEESEQDAAAGSAAPQADQPPQESDTGGVATPSKEAATAEAASKGAADSEGEADAAEGSKQKDTISFAEPEAEPAPVAESSEKPLQTETERKPKSKGPEIGLFSKPEASFFGVNVEAENIAFVVDVSSSMFGPTAEGWKTKFVRLKEELMRSVKGLSDKQLFTVVMFDNAPIIDQRFYRVKPSRGKISDLENYLDSTFPGNGTEPMGAMSVVLQEDYDVIFLLSDGEFDSSAIDGIRQDNSQHIVICTISLGADSLTLQRIAKDSGGRYKAVK